MIQGDTEGPRNFYRRITLLGLGSAAVGSAVSCAAADRAVAAESPIAHDARELQGLSARLSNAPRRRDFNLDRPDLWDAAALNEVIAYRGAYKQVLDNTVIGGPWLDLMRNSLNTQVFSFRHPDFLAVSATHGTAHLALFDQETWDKYQLAKLAGADFKTNTLILAKEANPSDFEDPKSVFGLAGSTVPALQSRGVVFLACHNEIWEMAAKLRSLGMNPDHLSHDTIAAELTNHLIDGVALTPGIGGTIPELQQAGFHYAA
jgi:hypothetical protein